MIGKILGQYELIEEVGRGGMAAVYRARQPNMSRFVAVKVIYRSIAADSKALDRFKREAELVAQLEHPHILPVYDYNGEHDPPYIVMRYLPTGTLRDVMLREQLPAGEVAYLLGQIAGALDYAHKKGIVHRDIKPSNIMIDGEGNAFLTDFGIARMVESSQGLTATGIAVGTPGYMAPEQGMGNAIDSRADVYALGVMVYEMLTGTMPFTGETPMAVILKHISEPAPDIIKANPGLPPAVSAVMQRAMAKTPADRYPTTGEFARAFQAALGSNSASAPNKLQEAAAKTIIELEAARAVAATNAPKSTVAGDKAGGASAPGAAGTPTGTQTGQVARGAAMGAGVVIGLVALIALGTFIGLQVVNGNNANATGTAVAVLSSNSTATAIEAGRAQGTSTTAAIALAGTDAVRPTLTPVAGTTAAPTDIAVTRPPRATDTPAASSTPLPTFTPRPTSTPLPTFTPLPTYTLPPTYTLFPTNTPSHTPLPTNTPLPPTRTATYTHTPLPTVTPSITPTFTSTPVPTATFTASPLPPTPTPIILIITNTPPPVEPTTIAPVIPTQAPIATATLAAPGALPYVVDYESPDALKLYDYDAASWRLLPDSGNTSLVGSGGQQKPLVVLGKGNPDWRDADNRNLLMTVSVNLLGDSSIGRIVFRHGDKGYYVLEISPGALSASRGSSAAVSTGTEKPLQNGRATGLSIRAREFNTFLIWADDNRVYVYLENKLVLQARDQSSDLLSGGNILFLTRNAGANFGVAFDNVKVQRPSVPSQHFSLSSWPATWDRSNTTDATLGGSDPKYAEVTAGYVIPKTGPLTDFLMTARLFNQEGGFDIRLRESESGYYLMRFDAGNMTLYNVDKDGKERPINVFQNFYNRGFFQEYTFEFVGDRVTINSGRTNWSQVIKDGPTRGTLRFAINRAKDGVRITDFLVAETTRSASESAAWSFEKIAAVEARTPAQLLTEFYDYFIDQFAKKDWWEGGASAPGKPMFDRTVARDHQQYLQLSYKQGESFRVFRAVPGEFLLFGSGSDKTKFFDATDVYLRVNTRIEGTGTAYIQVRTNKTVGGGALSGYQLALTRQADGSHTIAAAQIDSTGSRIEYYNGSLPALGDNPEYHSLLIVTYQDKVAFFVNGRFLVAQEAISILGGTVALGVAENSTARFDNFQLRDVSPETR